MLNATLTELAALLRSRKVSAPELAGFFLERQRRLDATYNCLISRNEEGALRQAEAAQQRIDRGDAPLLTGLPLIHKDIFCTRGLLTTCGSKMLENFRAPYDATVVAKLAGQGMVTLGKANMDEFAMGSSGETSCYGATRNPWDHRRVPGGSSSGSAGAVACRFTPAATGTDTGGSIRQPASFCGVTGMKPTYGRISRYGMIAFASSLDQAGTLTLSAEDAAHLLNAMAGVDANDATSSTEAGADYTRHLQDDVAGMKIGLPRQLFDTALDTAVGDVLQRALTELEGLGAKLIEVELPHAPLAIPAYYVISAAECSSNLARYDGVRYGYRCQHPRDLNDLYLRSRSEGFGREVKRRLMIGTFVLSAGYHDAYYGKALRVRRLVLDDFRQALAEVDVLAAPTSPTTAFALGEKTRDPVEMYLSDMYTVPASLAGLPALSLPAGFVHDLPVGLQLIGAHFQEARILNLAHRFQQVTAWHRQLPPAVGTGEAH